ncbi:hypothetical protein, partial [Acinetobacter baumannii]|uniref:hypothetical protein n=1 Tax=Acinetobacter baumannii TaxID=470 RepID=UPI00148F03C7
VDACVVEMSATLVPAAVLSGEAVVEVCSLDAVVDWDAVSVPAFVIVDDLDSVVSTTVDVSGAAVESLIPAVPATVVNSKEDAAD